MAVEKRRRVRLEVNGVVCGLITEESEAYMQTLADEVGALMQEVQSASPFITRESAALTVALSYCDDLKKRQERIEELEVEAELFQEEQAERAKNTPDAAAFQALQEKIAVLEAENQKLQQAVEEAKNRPAAEPEPWQPRPGFKYKNPMRYDEDGENAGLISFFEKK